MSLFPAKRPEPTPLFEGGPVHFLWSGRTAEGALGTALGAALGALAFRSAGGAVLGGLGGALAAAFVLAPGRSDRSEVELQAGDPGPVEGVV